jgi:hypothetical protein
MKQPHITLLLAFAVGVVVTIGITTGVNCLRRRSTANVHFGEVDFRQARLGDAIEYLANHKANASRGTEFLITPALADDLTTPAVSLSLSNATLSALLENLAHRGLCSYRIDESRIILSEHPSGVLTRATEEWRLRPDPFLTFALEQATNICRECGDMINEESANTNLHRILNRADAAQER